MSTLDSTLAVPPFVETALLRVAEKPASPQNSRRLLVKNTLWSFAGSGGPMILALVAVPLLIKGLGADRFGVLTLAWMAIGYLSLLDFGLGRALTKLVSQKLALGLDDEIPGTFWDSLVLLTGIGFLGGLLIWVLSNWLVGSMLKIPFALRLETLTCFHLIAATIPVVTIATGLRGFLEAHQQFRAVNIVRWVVGTLGFAVPVAVLHFSHRVDVTVAVLSGVRCITLVAFYVLCLNANRSLWRQRSIGTTPVGPLLRFGGWITFDNVIGPLMVTIDRFIIGSLISISMVTYYVTPQEVITKLLLIPMALQQAIFPLFSAIDLRETKEATLLYTYSTDLIFLAMFPLTILSVAFAKDVLTLWLGAPFAASSYRVLQILAVAAQVNAMAHVPSTVIQARGRPEWNAKLHTLELPIYLLVAWWMISRFGILGAACAWGLRALFDTVAFFFMGNRLLPGRPFNFATVGGGLLLIVCDFLLTTAGASVVTRSAYCMFAIGALVIASWPTVIGFIGLRAEA